MSVENLEKEIEPTESAPEIAKSLRAKFKSEVIDPADFAVIPMPKTDEQFIGSCANLDDGVDQRLRAVVKAGREFFGIVDVRAIGGSDESDGPIFLQSTALTRHIPGERAELIGFFHYHQPINIGRAHSPELNFSSETSGRHFTAQQNEGGAVLIFDQNSTNGTEVFTLNPALQHTDLKSPIDDFDFWSVQSASIKTKLAESLKS